MRVFISYAHEHRDGAEQIAIALANDGHKVVFDDWSIKEGEGYRKRLLDALEATDLFVFLISPESLDPSGFARAELDLAREKWPNPTGWVLPAVQVSASGVELPGYLEGLNPVEPGGDLPIRVLHDVRKISRARMWSRIRRLAVALVVTLVGVALALALLPRQQACLVVVPPWNDDYLHCEGTLEECQAVYARVENNRRDDPGAILDDCKLEPRGRPWQPQWYFDADPRWLGEHTHSFDTQAVCDRVRQVAHQDRGGTGRLTACMTLEESDRSLWAR